MCAAGAAALQLIEQLPDARHQQAPCLALLCRGAARQGLDHTPGHGVDLRRTGCAPGFDRGDRIEARVGTHQGFASAGLRRGVGAISTRRLSARPAASALEATGCSAPKAAANTADDGMPSSISARVTVSARWAESSQLSANLRGCRRAPAVVGEAADHQQLVARAQVGGQRRGQALQQLPAFGLQLVGVEGEQHAAADADAAVVQRDAARRQRAGQRLLERHAALLFGLALLHLGLQPLGQVELHAQHADQDQHEGAEQPGHQVAEHRPYGRARLHAVVEIVGHHAASASAGERGARPRQLLQVFDDLLLRAELRSMISRACAT